MNTETVKLLFALLRSAIRGGSLTEAEKALYSNETLPQLTSLAKKHDVLHLAAYALKSNGLLPADAIGKKTENEVFSAVYRFQRQKFALDEISAALEKAQIPFIPLKGSVIRAYYPEPWMRTSCDIDILVHNADMKTAISLLTEQLGYSEKERTTHDVSLLSQRGICVELHFDLVEENRANNAIDLLSTVWDNVSVCDNCACKYEMSDAFFYFYHIAHMAKHFENGGCGIRPFIDLWILDRLSDVDSLARDELLKCGNLLKFANAARRLSSVWMDAQEADDISCQMQEFILHGGVYGSTDNRVFVAQRKKGGRIRYIWSRIFVPYSKLKRYYPVLEKHSWLMPFMQIRRWFMLFDRNVRKMAKSEIAASGKTGASKADEMNVFLENIGLN